MNRQQRLNSLTVVRFLSGFFGVAIFLGHWEHDWWQRHFRLRRWNGWLINLGYGVTRLLWFLLRGVGKIFRWPLGVITLIMAVWLRIRREKPEPEKRPEESRQPFFRRRLSVWPKLAAFAVLLLLILSSLKFYGHWQFFSQLRQKIMSTAQAGLVDVLSAKEAVSALDFQGANQNFSQAGANFVAADSELKKVNGWLLTLVGLLPNKQARLAGKSQEILTAANLGSGLAADLSAAADSLFKPPAGQDLVGALKNFAEHGRAAETKAKDLNRLLEQVPVNDLPEEYRADWSYFQDKVRFIAVNLGEALDMADRLRIFLGEAYDKRYLLIFQNNTEARATGGFMGSYALVDFSRGRIKNLEVPGGGTYDTEAGLLKSIVSPRPLQLVKARWYFWDANWWPDWPMSARKIMWFYEQSGGSTVDGVISLTPDVVVDLLRLTGPIDLPEFQTTVSADNFMETVQTLAEQKPPATTKPKQIIGALTEALIAKLTAKADQDQWLKIINVIERSLNEKQILLYFSNQDLENKVNDLGWDGGLHETSGDYLSVINTNLNGGKSDGEIKQTVELVTNILADGSLVNHLTITRDHQGILGRGFGGMRNFDWLRIYVPRGSKLLSAEGFKAPNLASFKAVDPAWQEDPALDNERAALVSDPSGTKIYEEQGKTVFANWSIIDPGQATVIKLTYSLPFKLSVKLPPDGWLDKVKQFFNNEETGPLYRHSLLAQKQAGADNSQINYRLAAPSAYEAIWHYPENSGEADYTPQDTDKYWGFILRDRTF